MTNTAGYSYSLVLVTAEGRANRIHFQAETGDDVWMMQPGLDRSAQNGGWDRVPAWKYRAPTTICGLAVDGPHQGNPYDQHCAGCMAGVQTAHEEGVAILAERWAARWPETSREQARADFAARHPHWPPWSGAG